MNEIVTLVEIDWRQVIIALVLSLGVVVSVWKPGEFICSKLGIETRKQRDHKLLNQTIEGLAKLQDKHMSDMNEFKRTQEENVQQSIRHDEMIRDELRSFTSEIRNSIEKLNNQMKEYSDNRIHDREQSFEIQRELQNDSKCRDMQIEALMAGSMELLGDKIDQRFSRYVELGGIPENEVEEFAGIYNAYKGLGGNHKREEKYLYIKNHMKVLPVKKQITNVEG